MSQTCQIKSFTFTTLQLPTETFLEFHGEDNCVFSLTANDKQTMGQVVEYLSLKRYLDIEFYEYFSISATIELNVLWGFP